MLYEPTNIIPSTLTQTGTVTQADDVDIQWQINGNSAMTMFQIDAYVNNAQSTFVHSTGVISQYPSASTNSLPFCGKDRLGNYVMFSYAPADITWADWGLIDGNSYKFVITQFYAATSHTARMELTQTLEEGAQYYFSFTNSDGTYYVGFVATDESLYADGTRIYYNYSTRTGWIYLSDGRMVSDITFSLSPTLPSAGTSLGAATIIQSGDTFYNQLFTKQTAPSAIITRTAPNFMIESVNLPITTSIYDFTATYSQAQGDSISTVRWQLYDADDTSEPIDDTGEINTAVLEYSYSEFINGQSYVLVCTVITNSGIEVSDSKELEISYTQQSYTGDFSVSPICDENCNLLEWDEVETIPGSATPENGYTISDGTITLANDASISWSKIGAADSSQTNINFPAPWSAAWKGRILSATHVNYAATTINLSGATAEQGDGESGKTHIETVSGPATMVSGTTSQSYNQTMSGTISAAPTTVTETTRVSGTTATELETFVRAGRRNVQTVFFYQGRGFYYTATFDFSPSTIQSLLYINTQGYEYETSINGSKLSVTVYSDYRDTTVTINFQVRLYAPYYIATISQSVNGTITSATISNSSSNAINPTVEFDGSTYTVAIGSDSGGEDVWADVDLVYSVPGSGYYEQTFHQENLSSATFLSYTGTSATINRSGNMYTARIYGTDGQQVSGTIRVVYYVYTYEYNSGWINFDLGKITDIGLTVTSGIGASSQFTENSFYISIESRRQSIVSARVTITYTDVVYNVTLTGDFTIGTITNATISSTSDNVIDTQLNFTGSSYSVTLFTSNNNEAVTANLAVDYTYNTYTYEPQGQLMAIQGANNIVLKREGASFYVYGNNNVSLAQFIPPENVTTATVFITPSYIYAYYFSGENYVSYVRVAAQYTQPTVTAVTISGGNSGAAVDNVFVVAGDGSNILPQLSNYGFGPSWNSSDYSLYLNANFIYGIDGGTGTASGTGFYIYRRLSGETRGSAVATLSAQISELKDYGIKSNESYVYDFYVYDSGGAFMGVRSTDETPVRQLFNKYSLLATQFNDNDGFYHVVKEYLFSCNLQDEALSNNSNKSYVQNFTPYPTVFRSTANYASGTLLSLIGFVDKKTYRYWDDTALMAELNGLSTTDYTLFLRDMKGHLWMVDVGTVQQTVKYGTKEMQVAISLPWTEIGSAENVSIIQTPEDEGWDYDANVFDVILQADLTTGQLSVIYPYPYKGTTFTYTNSNASLNATTPLGVTPPTFVLPPVADEATDGELVATSLDPRGKN